MLNRYGETFPAEEPAILKASEVAEYVFCHQAWWLHRVLGYKSVNLAALADGEAAHTRHGAAVATALRWRRLAYTSLFLAGLMVAIVACWMVLGLR
jgi:hypothetical protein